MMINEIRDILALAIRALALYIGKKQPRKRIYLKRRDDGWKDSVDDIRAGRRGFLQMRRVRSQHHRREG